MPLARLRPSVRAALADIAATVEPFEVRFARVGHFPGVLYLVPEPAAPFERLTAAITARFPDYQPYEGAFDEVIAHLTIVESPKAPLDLIEAAVERYLPFVRRVSALEVLVDDQDGSWRVHWRIALGRRRPRRRGRG
jgi:2'-5' RNA ligase